jgi:hypothetical protein
MKLLLLHIFSGPDNQTTDVARVLWAVGVVSFIGFAGWHVIANHQFDPMAYGTGLGAVLAGGGAGVGLKYKAEPGA